ncbi:MULTISPECIES: NusA-like transcription termination signal-binding factor [Haloferax]|uniref:Probable transcription termination protein NusA n=1 Tax=Haloferax marinum TaxID=2666143 RepID=A0A6A8G8J8_9EURY|nr:MULTISPECIES: NusA-like transcription termination signal-binding factor [Haloferax]KAB1197393.1 NusA-like transcription termination signal-binding factor [Haloferax sp. CBA1150]MRW96436.1 NusA-like transcription termination signal-binding factor [Haloferax marinum]
MKVTLSDTARRYIALFEDETDATAHDCLVFDDRVVFLVTAGEMATAIGPGGRTVQSVERRIGRSVELVEDADTPEAFVASALAPAAVRHVTISRQNDTVAYVEVAEEDRGVAIGAGGKTIDTARELARRHYDIDDIQLT